MKLPVGKISSEMDRVGEVMRMWAADAHRFEIVGESR